MEIRPNYTLCYVTQDVDMQILANCLAILETLTPKADLQSIRNRRRIYTTAIYVAKRLYESLEEIKKLEED